MTPEFALSLLAAVGSFIGAVAVGASALGRRDQKIDTMSKEVDAMRAKLDVITTSSTEHGAGLHAVKNSQQAQELRHAAAVDKFDDAVAAIHSQLNGLALAMARVEAAIKKV